MNVENTRIPDVKVLTPNVHQDDRGFFYESFNQQKFENAVGRKINFVQDNHSRSRRGVLRGIHYQLPPKAQGKLVRVVTGTVIDVAVDLRRDSGSYGEWVAVELSAENSRQLWIPEGFGHAFLVVSDHADFLYKTTDYWDKNLERSIVWNDEDLNIDWPLDQPLVSEKDKQASKFCQADTF